MQSPLEQINQPTAPPWSVGVESLAHKQVTIELPTLLVLGVSLVESRGIDRYLHLMDARHRLNKGCERKAGIDRILAVYS